MLTVGYYLGHCNDIAKKWFSCTLKVAQCLRILLSVVDSLVVAIFALLSFPLFIALHNRNVVNNSLGHYFIHRLALGDFPR